MNIARALVYQAWNALNHATTYPPEPLTIYRTSRTADGGYVTERIS